MAKDFYKVERVDKNAAAGILLRYHYLKDISKGFKSGYNYGLFYKDKLVGVVIYTGFPVPELVKGMFGLERTDQKGMFELSRLCCVKIQTLGVYCRMQTTISIKAPCIER